MARRSRIARTTVRSTPTIRARRLEQGGIAPGVSLLFPGGEDGAANTDVVVMSGPEVVDICTGCRSLRKTYWRETAAQ